MATRRWARRLVLGCVALATCAVVRPADVRAAFPGANERIAFQRPTAGNYGEIWSVNADGTGETNLTNSSAVNEMLPAFSPDGTRIAYLRQEGSGDRALMVMDDDGTDKRVIASTAGGPQAGLAFAPTWSPDGTRIAIGGGVGSVYGIKVYDVISGALATTLVAPNGGSYVSFSWRPAAGAAIDIAAIKQYAGMPLASDIVEITPAGEVNLTNTPGDFNEFGQLHWSPDGEKVLCRMKPSYDVVAVDVAGGQVVLQGGGGIAAGQDISPDGEKLVFDTGIGSPIPATVPSIVVKTLAGGATVPITTGYNPCWGGRPNAGFQVTLEAFLPTGEAAEGQLLVQQDFTVKLTLTNGTNSKLDTFSYAGGKPLVVDGRGTGRLVITASPTIDPDLEIEAGQSVQYVYAVTTTKEGIAAVHSKVTARDEHGDDVQEFHSLRFDIANAQEVTENLARYVVVKAIDQYLFAQVREFQAQMQKRAERLRAALTKRLDAQERLEWFGSTAEIEVSNMDVAIGFLRGLPPELIASSRPKAAFKGHTTEELDGVYDSTFKEEAGKGLAKWAQGYANLAAGAKGLAEEGWAAALMNVGWLNSTATAEERAQVEAFWGAFAEGSANDGKALVHRWKQDMVDWQSTGKYMWQALDEADRDYFSVKAQLGILKKGYNFGAAIVKKETDVRASIMKLADEDPVAFQREWAKQDAKILNTFLPTLLDTILGAGVAKTVSVGGQLLKVKPAGAALLEGAAKAGYVDEAGNEVAAISKIVASDLDAPAGLAHQTGADMTKAERFLKDTEGATLVQSSDVGNVYSMPNLGGVPEPTLDAKAAILKGLEKDYLDATGKPLKLVEVLKTSSPLRKPGGVAKLELTAAKTGKASMIDGGMPPDALGEAAYWTSPTHPTDLPGFDKLAKARQEAAVAEWTKANERWAAYESPAPNSKEAHLKELIGHRGRVPLDDLPNAAGIQRFITGEFEEVVVTKGDATAKLIRVKHYEIEVVDTTRNDLVVNRKTVIDNLATAAPQTADADAVAVGKLVGKDPVTGAPIVEPLDRAEREFVMGRYTDRNIKARRSGLIPDNAEHGVTLVMEDASAAKAGMLTAAYGAPFLPENVARAYLARIAPFVKGSNQTAAEALEDMLKVLDKEGGFGQHAVVVTSDSRWLGAVPFKKW